MKQIHIGTCIPGHKAEEWIPHMIHAGFETVAVNFHMTLGGIDIEKMAPRVLELLGDKAYVGTLGYYCNPLQYEEHKQTLLRCIDAAHLFGTDMVSTFAGALEGESVEASMPRFKEVFTEITKYAADKGVKIAIENCPMGGSWEKTTSNIAFNPRAWEMMFHEVPAENLGLEWEPAHQMDQLIDPIINLRQWAPKVIHMHGKDATIDRDAVKRYGILGAKVFSDTRMPGFGDTNWRDVFTILRQHGYQRDICVEGYHDLIYSGDWEMTAQLHALNYLKWARGGEFIANPWDK